MSLESNKTLGGIGAILLAIPFLNLIGIILVLVAMKGMSDLYNDDEILKNTLYGFIFGIVGVVALIAVIIMLIIGSAVISPVIKPFGEFGLIIIAIIILYVFSLIASIFYKNALNKLSEKSGEQMFNTAGLILLIGAAIPVIGEILKFIAWILVAVGFFNIKKATQLPSTKPIISTSEGQRFCKYCGEQTKSNVSFCANCGKKID